MLQESPSIFFDALEGLIEKTGLLDVIAEQHRTFISNLRLLPELKWAALGDLYRLPDKERYPLKEWEEAVSYLLRLRGAF